MDQHLSSLLQQPKMVAEYAKSDSSPCKKCGTKILAKALRLGVARNDFQLSLLCKGDLTGYDDMNWYHPDCYLAAFGSLSFRPDALIDGFDSLKSNDQEIFRMVEERFWVISRFSKKEQERLRAMAVDDKKRKQIISKIGDDTNEEQQRSFKKTKLYAPAEEAELPIAISVSDIKYKYKGAALLLGWRAIETVIFLQKVEYHLQSSSKIAAFDFDGCLVNTDVKRVGPDAWSLMYPSVLDKLHSLYIDGYKLVIFTNDPSIEDWKSSNRQEAVHSKFRCLDNFITKALKVPIQVYIACGVYKRSDGKPEDRFRKPKTGMWRIMEQNFNSGIAIDMDQSFYVGNAAGRLNDHSDADIKFAQAVGLKFHVHEDYFDT